MAMLVYQRVTLLFFQLQSDLESGPVWPRMTTLSINLSWHLQQPPGAKKTEISSISKSLQTGGMLLKNVSKKSTQGFQNHISSPFRLLQFSKLLVAIHPRIWPPLSPPISSPRIPFPPDLILCETRSMTSTQKYPATRENDSSLEKNRPFKKVGKLGILSSFFVQLPIISDFCWREMLLHLRFPDRLSHDDGDVIDFLSKEGQQATRKNHPPHFHNDNSLFEHPSSTFAFCIWYSFTRTKFTKDGISAKFGPNEAASCPTSALQKKKARHRGSFDGGGNGDVGRQVGAIDLEFATNLSRWPQIITGETWKFRNTIRVLNQKIGGQVPPNHPFVHRVFHYFRHPFWGTPITGNIHTFTDRFFRSEIANWAVIKETAGNNPRIRHHSNLHLADIVRFIHSLLQL